MGVKISLNKSSPSGGPFVNSGQLKNRPEKKGSPDVEREISPFPFPPLPKLNGRSFFFVRTVKKVPPDEMMF